MEHHSDLIQNRNARNIESAVRLAIGAAALIAAGALTARVARRHAPQEVEDPSVHQTIEYDEAMEKIAHIQAFEKRLKLYEGCNTTVLTHGHKVEQVIILAHGLTSCPLQFVEFGTLLFEQGYNVLIPRLTYNGYADRETTDLQHLTVKQMRDYSAVAIEIAHGLGENVTYAGISAGGTMAAWVAQYRPDVDRAILIAPAFTIDRRLNATASRLVMYLLYLLPNIMTQTFRRTRGSRFGYPGFATRALATMMRLGFLVYDAALKTKPAVQSILTVTNAADPSMNNAIIRNLLNRWKKRGLRYCEQYEFEATHNLPHDIIGVQQPKQHVTYVYPILLALITKKRRLEDIG